MALPKGDQYNEAVQNPHVSFVDPELRGAKVESDFLGLPKPYSGGFTVTFRLQNASNNWAVRCMIREVPELQRRYQAIADFFSTHTSRFFIEAKYLSNGIKVNGSFYPVIKMKWMDGEPIDIYLSKNYNNKAKVEAILNDFISLINELEVLGISHGDLQQGNIIVKNDRLYLIDYDGMYLPALTGLRSSELGHGAFQHPQRSAQHFNAKIDRFSSLVIYLCLKGLLYKPLLWNKYHNSDNLLIKSQDIADLSNSALLNELSAIPEIKVLVERFIGVCHLDFDKIPSLKEFINGNFVYDKTNTGRIEVKESLYPVLDAKMKSSILEHYGERVEVVGRITDYYRGTTFSGKPYYFLNVGSYPSQTFTITIWSDGINALVAAGKSPSSMVGKWFSMIGVITSYSGRPQAVADSPSQIQILKNEEEAAAKLKTRKVGGKSITANRSNYETTGNTNTKKGTENKEADVFGRLYDNIPATPTIPKTFSSSNSSPQTRPSSATTKDSKAPIDDPGCAGAIVVSILTMVIIALSTGSPVGIIIGAVLGLIVYALFRD